MNSKRIIVGLVVLVLIGGITTALYRLAGGIPGEAPEGESRAAQTLAYAPAVLPLAADGFVLQNFG